MFTVVDWIVLVAYLLLSVAIGLFVSRGNKNLKEYMLGGGSIPWVAVGISLIATSVSATTFLGAPADVYGDNMTFLMFQIGALISIVVVGFVFIPRFRTSGINSAYELFEVRFSRPVRRIAAIFYCLHLLLRTGILLFAPSLVLAQILHIDGGGHILYMVWRYQGGNLDRRDAVRRVLWRWCVGADSHFECGRWFRRNGRPC